MLNNKMLAAVIAIILAFPTLAFSQDFSYGERLFVRYCSSCHGETGAGDGPVAEYFTHRPRDLTLLAKENGGSFPFVDVYYAIDGRRVIRAHGVEMPVWGSRLLEEAKAIDEFKLLHQGLSAEDIVQARILAIVYYIQTLQRRR